MTEQNMDFKKLKDRKMSQQIGDQRSTIITERLKIWEIQKKEGMV